MQYTPVLNTGLNWQIYNGPGFTGAVDIPRDTWFHLRLEVTGAQARLYVKDMDKPALVMDDLKSGVQKGQVALAVLTGATYFSNFEVRTTPDAPWKRQLPPMPAGHADQVEPVALATTRSSAISERPLPASESEADQVAGGGGGAARLRGHQSLSRDPASAGHLPGRLLEAPGSAAGHEGRVRADHASTPTATRCKKLSIGYSDDVSVFLNGRILYRGRSAQDFRDPGFLGIVNPENDAVYLPLKKGTQRAGAGGQRARRRMGIHRPSG